MTGSGILDRALGALTGVAVGDALGMPSQTLTRAEIRRHYGRIDDFVGPFDGHPVSHGLRAGQVTDDTEQSLLLARMLIDRPGVFNDAAWAQALIGWEADVRARGLRDLLGPSTKAALDALQAGVPATETGLRGTTNGAAMRIVPVGIATPARDPLALVDRIEATARITHNTGEAIAAAAAVATVISLGVSGATFDQALPTALAAARIANQRGATVGERDMAGRLALALSVADSGSEERLAQDIGTSVASRASVAAAFGVVRLARSDPWTAALIAANIGDDTDTIGAIATAMAGACSGLSAFPQDKVEQVMQINALAVVPTAVSLISLRDIAERTAA